MRRRRAGLADIGLIEESEDVTGQPILTPREGSNVVGLALSGGGIRSAAFCLGVLQALDAVDVLRRVDYLSTVSGGGYIGCSLTAALEKSAGPGWNFPFASRLNEDESPSLQHIRDYSNYLFPTSSALFRNASIYARGLAVNTMLVAPFVLIASAITLFLYWLGAAPLHGWTGILINPFGLPHFFVTIDLAVILAIVGVAWGLYRSANQDVPEIPSGWFGRWVGALAILVFIVAFCEIQPLVLDEMIALRTGNPFSLMPDMVKGITGVLAPVATVITFFASKVGEFVKSASESTKLRTQAALSPCRP